jgi:hypothetical protein
MRGDTGSGAVHSHPSFDLRRGDGLDGAPVPRIREASVARAPSTGKTNFYETMARS